LSEGEEGNAQRQNNGCKRQRRTCEVVQVVNKEVGVFEIDEKNEVDKDGPGRQNFLLTD
jgi:hypothetical protein